MSTYTGATTVTGGTLTLDGANRVAAASALTLGGGTLEIANAGGANGHTFASLSLTDSSVVDLDDSSLTFASLGSVASGKSLTVIDWSSATSPNYAFRIAGDNTRNSSFLNLLAGTTIDGYQVGAFLDGGCTDVRPVPLPASASMMIRVGCPRIDADSSPGDTASRRAC